MFSGKIRDLCHTLSFRLTLWYAGIFMITTLLLIFLFYSYIASHLIEDLDRSLGEEITEFRSLLNKSGLEAVKKYMVIEVDSEIEDSFFRLFSSSGQEIILTTNFPFRNTQQLDSLALLAYRNGEKIFSNIDAPGYPNQLRTVSGDIGQGFVLQTGESLADYEKTLSFFKRFSLLVVFPLVALSTIVGWFLARQALKGVEKVTLIAEKIAGGDYDQRVRLKRSTSEVEKLADTFNNMLDRIQALIRGMKEVTDNIAHDLRSPLARIRGKAEMALLGAGSQTSCSDMAASTIEECDNLIDMINTMLDITEVEAGVSTTDKEKVEMNRLILSACDLFEPIAEEKGVKVMTSLPDNELYFLGDKHKLQRLVTNFIENGIKYNRPGGTVTVTLKEEDRQIKILFEDTGIGISEQNLSRIFDRFYRCDTSRSEPGLGLGLSLAKAIARASGGDIEVKSTLNQGSLFIIRLPL